MNPHAAVPRRPLTVGEVLDAAAQLVRQRPVWLLSMAAALAALEQGALYAIRSALGVDVMTGFTGELWDRFGAMWVVMALGCGFEAFIIGCLGQPAGRLAADDLTGAARRPRLGAAVVITASLAAVATAAGAFLGPFWLLGYALFGVCGAAIGLEGRGPLRAIGRGASMAFLGGMRVTAIRVLGYAAWLLLRLGFALGVISLFDYFAVGPDGAFWVLTVGFFVANTAAYAFLAALDAVVLAEARFRAEGLDIWLARAQRHGTLTPESVAVR